MTRAHQAPVPGEYVGTRLAAERLGVTERTVLRWCDDGVLPVAWVTPGGHRRIAAAAVTAQAERLEDARKEAEPA